MLPDASGISDSRHIVERIERLVRRDPARRGLISAESRFNPLCAGHLHDAAAHLAACAQHVGLVTGFFVPSADPPAAETDGPPGAMLLARGFHAWGIAATVITDERCAGAVRAAAEAVSISESHLFVPDCDASTWVEDFYSTGPGRSLTHLISVERVGPSHTIESMSRQPRHDAPPVEQFAAAVPADQQDRCHNMWGRPVDDHTGGLHRLFEEAAAQQRGVKTIGIGDGGNEIGMGSIPWEELFRRMEGPQAAVLPCRVPTDWTIVAGVSNWGAQALAAALAVHLGQTGVLHDWDMRREEQLLARLVERGPAVDGITGRRETTVDGLPFITYIQPWLGIRRLLGLVSAQ